MIEIKNLHKKYDDITVVDDLSLEVGGRRGPGDDM